MKDWEDLASRLVDLWNDKGEDWFESSDREMMKTIRRFAEKQEATVSQKSFFKSVPEKLFKISGNPIVDAEVERRVREKLRFPIVTAQYKSWSLVTRIVGPVEIPVVLPGKVMVAVQGAGFVPSQDFSLTIQARGDQAHWLSKPMDNLIRLWPEFHGLSDRKTKPQGSEVRTGTYDIDSMFSVQTNHAKLAPALLSRWRVREKILASKPFKYQIVSNKAAPEKASSNAIVFCEIAKINSAEEMTGTYDFFKDTLDVLLELNLISNEAPPVVEPDSIFDF